MGMGSLTPPEKSEYDTVAMSTTSPLNSMPPQQTLVAPPSPKSTPSPRNLMYPSSFQMDHRRWVVTQSCTCYLLLTDEVNILLFIEMQEAEWPIITYMYKNNKIYLRLTLTEGVETPKECKQRDELTCHL